MASACTSRSLCNFAIRGQSFISPSKSGGSTRAYWGGSPAMARSKSRILDKCSSTRALSSVGSDFSSVEASARTTSRMLRSKQAVKQPVRNHLRRQRPLVSRPTHVALHALAPEIEGARIAHALPDHHLRRSGDTVGSNTHAPENRVYPRVSAARPVGALRCRIRR
jgi:hypothetical protein